MTSAYSMKSLAISTMAGVKGVDKWLDDRIEKAEKHIVESLAAALSETAESLTSQRGKRSLTKRKTLSTNTGKFLPKKDTPQPVKDAAIKAVHYLVMADKALAQKAIDEASGLSSDKKVQHEIDKANEEMLNAQEAFDAGDYDKAIDHYKKAWEHAQKAMKKILA